MSARKGLKQLVETGGEGSLLFAALVFQETEATREEAVIFRRAMRSSNWVTRYFGVASLKVNSRYASDSTEELLALLGDSVWAIRREAAEQLMKLGPELRRNGIDALLEAALCANSDDAEEALTALRAAKIDSELEEFIRSGDDTQRKRATRVRGLLK